MNPNRHPLGRVARAAALVPLLLAGGCGDILSPGDPGNLVPRTVDEDPALPALALNGSLFHLEALGDPGAPVIVFLHGGPGGDYRALTRLLDARGGEPLTASYRVILWDQRSAGLSRRHDKDEISIDLYMADLLALSDYFSPNEPVVLVGHSWGGMYATEFINQYPDRVRGAVLIEPGPFTGQRLDALIDADYIDLDFMAEWLNDYAWSNQFFTPDDHERWDYQHALGWRESQPKLHMDIDNDPELFWRWGAAASRYIEEDGQDDAGNNVYDFSDNLSAYTGTALFIASGLDEVLGEEFQREQMRDYANAEVRVVPGVGHDLQWAKADDVLDLIREYLATLEAQGGAR